ncbi:MAG: ribbon-helix-helix protein, CopG family [Candidatus Helarchaeota archaeon]
MRVPSRITIAIDEKTAELLEKTRNELKISQSELVRRALNFYYKYKDIVSKVEFDRLLTYLDMLPNGEHIILDVDHWLSMLKLLENNEEFWKVHDEVSSAHAETLPKQIKSPVEFLKRLEACNFYSLNAETPNHFTLILGSDIPKKFLTVLIEKVISAMGFDIEIKEGIAKLIIKIEKK